MQKRITVIVCFWLVFLGGWAFGQKKILAYDGTTWRTLSRSERATYVLGFLHGYEAGAIDRMLCRDCVGPQLKAQLQEIQVDWGARAQNRIDILIKDNAVDPIVDTMSTFYGDYKNVAVCWPYALTFSAESVAGRPPTERELDIARKVAAESGCQ